MVDWRPMLTPQAVPEYVAVFLMLAIAGLVFFLGPNRRAHRALALLLLARAMAMLTATAQLQPGVAVVDRSILIGFQQYFSLAVPFAVIYFVSAYPKGRGPLAHPLGAVAFWLVFLVVEVAYFVDHCTFACVGVDDAGVLGLQTVAAPAIPFFVLFNPFFAMGAFVFARDHVKAPPGTGRSALYFVSLAFTAHAAYDVSAAFFQFALGPVNAVQEGRTVSNLLTGLFLLATLITYYGNLSRTRSSEATSALRGILLIALLPILANAAMSRFDSVALRTANVGVWRLLMASLFAYAILKHRLFDIDLKVKWTIKQSTVAAIFLTVFFLVSEGAQILFAGEGLAGQLVGLAAAGALVFALAPLQGVAERVATAALPNARPVSQMSHPELVEIYREHAQVAWADGTISTKERMLLDTLRDRLRLSTEEASGVESDVARAAGV